MDFIANRIIEAREISVENGKAKYRAYFVNLTLYAKFRSKTDEILISKGKGDCIVTE